LRFELARPVACLSNPHAVGLESAGAPARPEAGDAAPFVVGVERQVQADRILDAARETHRETHARVGLFFHGVFLGLLHYSIDAGMGQTSPIPSCGQTRR